MEQNNIERFRGSNQRFKNLERAFFYYSGFIVTWLIKWARQFLDGYLHGRFF